MTNRLAAITAAITTIATAIAGAVTAITTLHGSAQTTALASAAGIIATACWKLLDTLDKHAAHAAAVDLEHARTWAAAHIDDIEHTVATLAPIADTIPGVATKLAALETTVADLAGRAAPATDLDALAEAVKTRLAAQLTAPATPAA